MTVRLLVSLSGANGSFNAGDEYECGADEAGRLIEAGYAEPVREVKAERAVKAPKVEKAAK
jgi:hypothetical protein